MGQHGTARACHRDNAFYYVTATVGALAALAPGLGLPERAIVFFAGAYAVVVAHELGHAIAAWGTGRRVTGFVALPWSGTTWVRGRRGDLSWIGVALAGPLAGIAFAAMLLTGVSASAGPAGGAVGTAVAPLLQLVLWVSILESAANLLPFGQLDGNRIAVTVASMRRRSVLRRSPAVRIVMARTVSGASPAGLGSARGAASPMGVAWALRYLEALWAEDPRREGSEDLATSGGAPPPEARAPRRDSRGAGLDLDRIVAPR